MSERILILDFGSQVTQLIARRVRESGVYSEIHPCTMPEETIRQFAPSGIILSGGPASVHLDQAPAASPAVFALGVPVLGICYGQQWMCHMLGGQVAASDKREFGRAELAITGACKLFDGVWQPGETHRVWMSHGDSVTTLPEGFIAVAKTDAAPFAAIANEQQRYYGVQFHPEVVHTPDGAKLIRNFTHAICGCSDSWSMENFREQSIARIRNQVSDGRVLCAVSGGVDSSVVAKLLHEAIGDQLLCVFVDTGCLRKDEGEQVRTMFEKHYHVPLTYVDASQLFLHRLSGVEDPEQKRKIIGNMFIEVFEKEVEEAGGADFLAQGTLYPGCD